MPSAAPTSWCPKPSTSCSTNAARQAGGSAWMARSRSSGGTRPGSDGAAGSIASGASSDEVRSLMRAWRLRSTSRQWLVAIR